MLLGKMSCSICGNRWGSLAKALPQACCGQQLAASPEAGTGLRICETRSPARRAGDLHTRSCDTSGCRSQVLMMLICLNHHSIFSLSFQVTCTTKSSPASFNFQTHSFVHEFGKPVLAFGAIEWCNVSVSLSHSHDTRKTLSKDFSPVTCPAAGTTNQTIQKGFGRCLITHVTADRIQNLKGYLLSECRYHQLLHIFNRHWKPVPEKRHQPTSCSVFLSRYVDAMYWGVSHGCPPAWNNYSAVWRNKRLFHCMHIKSCSCLLIQSCSLKLRMKLCACMGEREREMAKKPFKASHSFVFYLYLEDAEMTNFCPTSFPLKRDVDWELRRLFSNSYQKEVFISRVDWMFLH